MLCWWAAALRSYLRLRSAWSTVPVLGGLDLLLVCVILTAVSQWALAEVVFILVG